MDFKLIREDLLKLEKPELLVVDRITREMYFEVGKAFIYLKTRNSPALKIVIDSEGGDVEPGLDIYDLIRLYEGETTGLVIGRAASMAAIILQACKTRQCARHAGILIHYVSRKNVSLDVLEDPKKLKELKADLRKTQRRLYAIIGERSKKSESEIATECKKDNMMTSDEAKAFGLIDEII